MGFSPLADMSRRMPHGNRQTPRGNNKITGFTIHHQASVNSTAGTARGREVSANYWIENDGTIVPQIDENYRAWTTGHENYPAGAQSDFRNITVEVSNTQAGVNSGTWAISDAAMKSLISLIADVYKRHGLGPVIRDYRKGLAVHQDFVPTACPGPYIMGNLRMIVAEAEKVRSGAKPAPTPKPTPAPVPYSGDATEFLGGQIVTTSGWYNYTTAADAKHLRNPRNLMPAGTYVVSTVADGQPHLKNVNGKHSGWVHSSVLTGQKPAKKPAPAPKFPTIKTTAGWYNYKTAADAKALKNAQHVMPAGTYEITKTSDGQPHLRNVNGKHSGWVHQSVLGGPEPTKPKPAPAKPKKTIDQMAREIIAGKHGQGHPNRQKSLGISAAEYAKVRARVNQLV